LEEMLGNYAGTVILVSHDRDFLDRVVNSVVAPEGDGRWVEYAGGYSDMLAQRQSDLTRRPAASSKPVSESKPAAPAPETKAAKRRLSFNEKHALETLPKQMTVLQAKITELQKKLDDPKLYTRDPKAFTDTSSSLATAQNELSTAEERWLELEMLREELEGRA